MSKGIIIEAKWIFVCDDSKKHLRIKKQYPNLDILFVVQNPNNKLDKGSKTTYADWCKKYGYKYATKLIPDSWFREKHKNTDGLLLKKEKSG